MHRNFENLTTKQEIFETGIKVIDLIEPTRKAERQAYSAVQVWARQLLYRNLIPQHS